MSKYDPLRSHFRRLAGSRWTASFSEIEQIIGSTLPPSARTYHAWWGNSGPRERQSSAWLDAGWRVEIVYPDRGLVTFCKADASRVQAPSLRTHLRAREPGKPPGSIPIFAQSFTAQLSSDDTSNIECTLGFRWEPLGRIDIDKDGRLVFPAAPDAPGLYRLWIRSGAGRAMYIGETDNLRRRFQGYRTPGDSQLTNIRIRGKLSEVLASGAEVDVAVVTGGAWLAIAGKRASADLSSKAVRRALENVALLASGAETIESLNR